MKKECIVRQRDIRDCGPCCLLSIIRYYNGNIPMETLRMDTKTDASGSTAYNLIHAAKKYGLDSTGLKIEDINLSEINLPAIAHVELPNGLNHFVVIYKIASDYIEVMDPSTGKKKISIIDFKKIWTNVILIFEPYKKITNIKNKNSLLHYLLFFIKTEKKLFTKILLFNLISIILSISASYYFKIIINSLEYNYKNLTLLIVLVFLFITILRIYYDYIKNILSIYLNKNIDMCLYPSFFEHIFHLPLNIIKGRSSGEIITRIGELNNVKELISDLFITILLNLSLGLCSIYFLFRINAQLFLILCLIAIIYIIIGTIYGIGTYHHLDNNILVETEFNSLLIEKIDSLETIKNLNIVDKTLIEIKNKYYTFLYGKFNLEKYLNKYSIIKKTINDIGLFIISSYGVYLIYNNMISLVTLITFNTLLSYFITPIEDIINLIPRYNLIKLSIIKINEFLCIESEHYGEKTNFKNGLININDVTYSYNNYENILENLNLTIKEKEHITIKGSSGCGKSTLCNILNRNIEDYNGNIYIDGINIKDYSLNTIKDNIKYVSQREKIFTDTIYNNITLGRKINIIELNEVLKITQVDEIIDKRKMRLESLLIDSGYNLSGGERQRIILARAILSKPKILILDESLSELDKKKEREILLKMDKYLKNITIIYISHNNTNYFEREIDL